MRMHLEGLSARKTLQSFVTAEYGLPYPLECSTLQNP